MAGVVFWVEGCSGVGFSWGEVFVCWAYFLADITAVNPVLHFGAGLKGDVFFGSGGWVDAQLRVYFVWGVQCSCWAGF